MRYAFFFIPLFAAIGFGSCGNAEPAETRAPHADTLTSMSDTPATDTLPLFSADELLGRIRPSAENGFTLIDTRYTDKQGIYMRAEAYDAFVKMAAAAEKDGFRLKILSATRTFYDQKKIWEDKWNGLVKVGGRNLNTVSDSVERALAILTYSSMPSTSRHHWGTDIDLNSLEPAWFNTAEGSKLYDWLTAHAPSFGFCQPYSEKGESRPEGYNEEKWHWSYMPLSKPMLDHYLKDISYNEISGFSGCETAVKIKVIEKYVKGVAEACKNP